METKKFDNMFRKKKIIEISEYITKHVHAGHNEWFRNQYIKYYYFGLIKQSRNIIKDYIFKKKYKVIDYNGEFGTELKFVIPFAYWHYKNGTLKKTISCKNTKAFYFFSPNHEERYASRKWKPYFNGIPNSEDHNVKYNLLQWERVPYREIFKNQTFIFPKPPLIVANKHNTEWGKKPVNYLSIALLRYIFENYSSRYTIVYNRPISTNLVHDESDVLFFDDFKLINEEFSNIIEMNSFFLKNYLQNRLNFNQFQMLIYSNADHFISVHGGAAVLASCFGGINTIFSVKGFEHYFKELKNFYPKLSSSKILHAKSDREVIDYMNVFY